LAEGLAMSPLDLTDAEQLKRVVVEPLIAALRAEMREAMQPVLHELAQVRQRGTERDEQVASIEKRLHRIERLKTRIAGVCSVVALIVGVAWQILSEWIGSYFYRGH
jgi:hypothetical protein